MKGKREQAQPQRLRRFAVLALVTASLLLFNWVGHASAQTPPTISMPAGVFGVAVNPTSNLVYVLLNDNTIRIIDGASDTLTATVIPVCSPNSFGGGLDVNPQTNKIYVAHQSCGGIMQVISGVTNTVTATVSLGGCPSGPRINSLTNRVYIVAQCVPEGVQDGLYVVDGSADTVIDANPGPGRPFDLNGVASSVVVNPTTNQIYTTVTPGFDIGGLTTRVIDGVTNTLVTSIPGVHVGVVNPTTNRFYGFPDGVTEIRIFNGVTHTQTGTIPGVTGSMDVNPDTNRIYVALQSLSQLAIVDGNTNTVSRTVALGFSPTLVAANHSTGKVYVSISSGTTISVVQDTAMGNPFAWGDNNAGKLGNGSGSGVSTTPTPVNNLTGVIAVAMGANHSLALKPATSSASSSVFAWGDNSVGELGDGTNNSSFVPIQVGGLALSGVTAIAAGINHSLALRIDTFPSSASSTVLAWGSNSSGQLGTATSTTSSNTPLLAGGGVLGAGDVAAIAAGGAHSLAIRGTPGFASSTVVAWGENNSGQLGLGFTGQPISIPQTVVGPGGVGTLNRVSAIASGGFFTLALVGDVGSASTTVFAWGANGIGQVGAGFFSPTVSTPTPVVGSGGIGTLNNVVAIAGGFAHAMALRNDGMVFAWGRDVEGQLGDAGASGAGSFAPVQVIGLTNVVAIAAGRNTSYAQRADGTLFAWGDNNAGEVGNLSCSPTCNVPAQVVGQGGSGFLSNVVAIGTGNDATHSLAIVAAPITSDVTPPSLVTFSFTPVTIDTTTSPATVNVTMHLTDSQSGVCDSTCLLPSSHTQVRFTHVGTGQIRDGLFSLASGSLNDGTFQAQVTFPQGSAAGTWKVTSLLLVDTIGNVISLSEANLTTRGFPTQLVNTGSGDATPPTLVSFAFNPTTIDTTTGAAIVTVTMHVTDIGSGVCLSTCADLSSPTQVRFQHAGTGQFHDGLFTLVTGTLTDGIFQAQVTFPQLSAGGTWTVTSLLLADFTGNRVSLTQANLNARGFPTTLTNSSATGDITPPSLATFTFTPTIINTAAGPATVTVTMRLTDSQSGVCASTCLLPSSPTQVRFTHVGTGQIRDGLFSLASGSLNDGNFQAQVTFPQGSAAGTWNVTSLLLVDAIGNVASLSQANLTARGFPTQLVNGQLTTISIDPRVLKAAGFNTFEIVGVVGGLDTATVQNLQVAPSTNSYALRAPSGGGPGEKILTFKVNAQCDLTIP